MIKNRYLKILLLPILAVVLMIGYTAYAFGEPKQRKKDTKQKVSQPTQNPTSTFEIGVLSPQEQPLIIQSSNKKEKKLNLKPH